MFTQKGRLCYGMWWDALGTRSGSGLHPHVEEFNLRQKNDPFVLLRPLQHRAEGQLEIGDELLRLVQIGGQIEVRGSALLHGSSGPATGFEVAVSG